jgi:hypothetical protein
MKESRKARPEGTGLWRYVRNAKAPEIPVVILEDFAALTGLVIALAAVIVSELTHNPKWDAYGTIAIGGLLGIVALVLASEMKSLLIGESASPNVQEAIRAALEIEPAVMKVIHLRTQHLGPEELLVAAKVEFLHHLTLPEVAEAVDRVEANVRANVPEAKVMYIEPDVAREFVAEPLVAEHTGLSTSEWLEETTGQLQAIAVESGSDEPLAAEELAEPGPPSLPPLMLDPDAPPYPPPPPPAPDLTRTRPIASSDLWGRRPGLAGDLPSDSEADIDNTGGS